MLTVSTLWHDIVTISCYAIVTLCMCAGVIDYVTLLLRVAVLILYAVVVIVSL